MLLISVTIKITVDALYLWISAHHPHILPISHPPTFHQRQRYSSEKVSIRLLTSHVHSTYFIRRKDQRRHYYSNPPLYFPISGSYERRKGLERREISEVRRTMGWKEEREGITFDGGMGLHFHHSTRPFLFILLPFLHCWDWTHCHISQEESRQLPLFCDHAASSLGQFCCVIACSNLKIPICSQQV